MRFDSLAVDSFFTVHILFDIYGLLPCVVFENGFFCLLLYIVTKVSISSTELRKSLRYQFSTVVPKIIVALPVAAGLYTRPFLTDRYSSRKCLVC